MNIVQRVQDILLKPRETWPVIEAEPATIASIYQNYVLILAAIPAVASFIGLSIVGIGGFVSFRVPIVSGLANMIVGYVLSLVMVFVLSLIVDALAPSFGATKNPMHALKLVAYSMTVGFVGGIFSILPALSILGVLAGLYSIYLIYTGLPVLMKCPEDKAVGYTAVVMVCGLVSGIIIGVVSSMITPSGMSIGMGAKMGTAGRDDVTIKVPGTDISINTAQMEATSKKVEAANQALEKAQASGDPAAAGKAAADMMAAALGGLAGATGGPAAAQGGLFSPEQLKAFVPATLAGMPRESFKSESMTAMGITGSTVHATYRAGNASVNLKLIDMGAVAKLAMAAWSMGTMESEDKYSVERVYKQGARSIKESAKKDNSKAEIDVLLENGLLVELESRGADGGLDGLRQQLAAIGIDQMAAMKRPGK